jgi:hypothetical protein
MKRLCGALALLSLVLPMLRAADDKPKADQIRVYVFTAGPTANEFTAPGQTQRVDSTKQLAAEMKKKKFTVVQDSGAADITIELLKVGQQSLGHPEAPPTTYGANSGLSPNPYTSAVRVKLSAGEFSTIIDGLTMPDTFFGADIPRQPEHDAANKIEAWTKDNQTKLLAARAH